MARALSEGVALFLLPFALYAAFVALRPRLPIPRRSWTDGTIAWLTASGLILAIVSLFILGLFGERHRGAYRPAHFEKGRLVPGQID